MTTVLTSNVRRVYWFVALFSMSNAVVYLSHSDMFLVTAEPTAPMRAKNVKKRIVG